MLKADKDSVIMMINYFIQKQEALNEKQVVKERSDFVKVTDETATGGWW